MQSQQNIIDRVQRGDLTGLNIVGLVRLSFEASTERQNSGIPMTGGDINNRDEQEDLCRRYVESRGGTYVGTYDEPHTSAWKKKRIKQEDGSYIYRVIRPVFEGMLSDLKKGRTESKHFTPADGFGKLTQVDGSVVYDIDRLTRDHRNLADAIEVVEYYHRPILDIRGSLDLLTDNGRSAAWYILNARASSSSDTSRRLKDSHLSRAKHGIPVGGNRAFGWADDKRTLVHKEAVQIRAAARLLLAGVGAHTIVNKWNAMGRLTSQGNLWRRRTFVLMITSPRMVGYRVYGPKDVPHHMRYLTDDEGNPIKGQYESILDEHTWHSVVDLLAGPDRPGAGVSQASLKYMCTGRIRCGNCGSNLRGTAKPNNRHDYSCDVCHKVAGSGIAIDDLVTKLIFARLAEQELVMTDTPWSGADELAELTAKKKRLLAEYKDNDDMGSLIFPKIRKIEPRIAELMKERAAHTRRTAAPKTTNIIDVWAQLAPEQRRAVVDENFETFVLKPATKGSNRFNPDRLVVVPRQ
ncbi:recombinase family protein [Streptomyces sp. NPDC057307]|uniref:recombinase family protein n=1 Tax=Streptomyces sp. NPDC057307 TaxID=3346096 RepID=UPI00362BC350